MRLENRLAPLPGPGGTHRWLASSAARLRRVVDAEQCVRYLRARCDRGVHHREVPDREIEAAVRFAYGSRSAVRRGDRRTVVVQRRPMWPEPDEKIIGRVITSVSPCFDGVTDAGLGAADALSLVFAPAELVCCGGESRRAVIHPLERTLRFADMLQFICPNPMRGPSALNKEGRESARCQNNVAVWRHVIAEFDDRRLTKTDQARLITLLAERAPLVLVADSGGKSLHAWFRVQEMREPERVRFFTMACRLGADPSRYDCCGWTRMPGGRRVRGRDNTVPQRVVYGREPKLSDGVLA